MLRRPKYSNGDMSRKQKPLEGIKSYILLFVYISICNSLYQHTTTEGVGKKNEKQNGQIQAQVMRAQTMKNKEQKINHTKRLNGFLPTVAGIETVESTLKFPTDFNDFWEPVSLLKNKGPLFLFQLN